ncbi:hypothetical protein PIB30_009551 [Stylosanthes scabra]|uniref:Uncharacterized protein n=1 Tax=Stylosanthes scabra TaxID=79078 RepID=A0ABU6Q538_9FABA|nr:hypothetical protein [Stylosanthes scabra]
MVATTRSQGPAAALAAPKVGGAEVTFFESDERKKIRVGAAARKIGSTLKTGSPVIRLKADTVMKHEGKIDPTLTHSPTKQPQHTTTTTKTLTTLSSTLTNTTHTITQTTTSHSPELRLPHRRRVHEALVPIYVYILVSRYGCFKRNGKWCQVGKRRGLEMRRATRLFSFIAIPYTVSLGLRGVKARTKARLTATADHRELVSVCGAFVSTWDKDRKRSGPADWSSGEVRMMVVRS